MAFRADHRNVGGVAELQADADALSGAPDRAADKIVWATLRLGLGWGRTPLCHEPEMSHLCAPGGMFGVIQKPRNKFKLPGFLKNHGAPRRL